MDYHLILCLIIFTATIISYILNKVPMWVTSLVSMLLLVLTGCLKGRDSPERFRIKYTILMASMFMVAAGLRKASLCIICERIMKLTKDPLNWHFSVILSSTMILANFISKPDGCICYYISTRRGAVRRECQSSQGYVPNLCGCDCLYDDSSDRCGDHAGRAEQCVLQTYEYTAFQMNPMDFLIAKMAAVYYHADLGTFPCTEVHA